MSLKGRILILLVLVTVLVTGALATIIYVNERDRRIGLEKYSAQIKQKIDAGFAAQYFQDRFSLGEFKEDEPPLKKLASPSFPNIKDAMCLFQRRRLVQHQTLSDEIVINPLGNRHRDGFDEDRYKRKIREAIHESETSSPRKNVLLREDDWFVAPIYFTRVSQVEEGGEVKEVKKEELWGGGLFRLDYPLPPQLPAGLPIVVLLVMMGVGMLLTVLGVYWALHTAVLRPLASLGAGAERVAQGDYATPVALAGRGDEVDRLVRAFNAMMASVADYYRHLEQRVQEATAKAEAARRHLVVAQRLAATGTLASGIAHEINNPLGGLINAALSLKKRGGNDARTQQYLDLIIDGLGRIRDTVRKVLAFSPRRTQTQLLSLRTVIDQAHALMDHKLRKLNANWSLSGEDASVHGEPGELQQVFLNLFLNAADAMDQVPSARLEVRLVRVGDRVRIDVKDNGCGMAPEDVERAFDLFFTTKDTGEGSGLGLSIAHRIISDHGGTIDVQSEKGQGTTFSVWLPLAAGAGAPPRVSPVLARKVQPDSAAPAKLSRRRHAGVLGRSRSTRAGVEGASEAAQP